MEDCFADAVVNGIEAPISYPEFCAEKGISEYEPESHKAYSDYYCDFGTEAAALHQFEQQAGCLSCGD